MSIIWIIVLIIGVAMATYCWWKIAASFVTDGPAESCRVRRNGIIMFFCGSGCCYFRDVFAHNIVKKE